MRRPPYDSHTPARQTRKGPADSEWWATSRVGQKYHLEEVDELAARNCWRESWMCSGVMVGVSYDDVFQYPPNQVTLREVIA